MVPHCSSGADRRRSARSPISAAYVAHAAQCRRCAARAATPDSLNSPSSLIEIVKRDRAQSSLGIVWSMRRRRTSRPRGPCSRQRGRWMPRFNRVVHIDESLSCDTRSAACPAQSPHPRTGSGLFAQLRPARSGSTDDQQSARSTHCLGRHVRQLDADRPGRIARHAGGDAAGHRREEPSPSRCPAALLRLGGSGDRSLRRPRRDALSSRRRRGRSGGASSAPQRLE